MAWLVCGRQIEVFVEEPLKLSGGRLASIATHVVCDLTQDVVNGSSVTELGRQGRLKADQRSQPISHATFAKEGKVGEADLEGLLT